MGILLCLEAYLKYQERYNYIPPTRQVHAQIRDARIGRVVSPLASKAGALLTLYYLNLAF